MDKKTLRFFSAGIIVSFLLLTAFMAYYIMSGDTDMLWRSMLVLLGIVIAIVISYSMYYSFTQSEKNIIFGPDERLILQRKSPEKSTIIPQLPDGGFSPDLPPVEVNLYLTNIGILAENPPGSGQSILFVPHDRIMQMQVVTKMFAKFVRVQYLDETGNVTEVLLHVGKDAEKWASKIGRILTGMQL